MSSLDIPSLPSFCYIAVVVRSLAILHSLYLSWKFSKTFKKLKLQPILRVAASISLCLALSLNLYTQFLRWYPWWEVIDGGNLDNQIIVNIGFSMYCFDVIFNLTYWITILSIVLAVFDRFQRIYLSDFEIAIMAQQAAAEDASDAAAVVHGESANFSFSSSKHTKLFTKSNITKSITIILALMTIYSGGWSTFDAFYGIVNRDLKSTPSLSVSTPSKIIVASTLINIIIYELTLNLIMVVFLSRNLRASKVVLVSLGLKNLKNVDETQSQTMTTILASILNRAGVLKSSDPHSKLMFSAISLLMGIFLCDFFSLCIFTVPYFVLNTDKNSSFALNMVSISLITPHLHCSFTLTDFMLTSIKKLKREVIAARSRSRAATKAPDLHYSNYQASFQSCSRSDVVRDGLLSDEQSFSRGEFANGYSSIHSPEKDIWLSTNAD